MNKLYTLFLIMSGSVLLAQSPAQLKNVLKNTNVSELNRLSQEYNDEYLERESRIQSYLKSNPTQSRIIRENGVYKEIYDVLDNEILYYSTSNRLSAQTIRANRLYSGGTLGLNIAGQGMQAIVWDGGVVRNTHQEFPLNKVVLNDTGSFEEHPTHVAGTIVAKGITTNARGIAYEAGAKSYNWTNDYSEMATEASFGLLVSNHSYWMGSQLSSWVFGAYDSRARQFDEIAFNAPYYLAVTAAGNDRNDFSNTTIAAHLNSKGGYNLIRGMQNAKNFLTVGAVNQVLNYSGPQNVTMSSFSSWGPTDDGRIKPDVVAKGVSVYSTIATNDTAYGTSQGTSMASPAVAGVALLLQQYYYSLNNDYMRAATLKGIINHTADECGTDDGPDYKFGWGLVNAEAAATLIAGKGTTAVIEENILTTANNTYTKTVASTGSSPLMVSISWTDRQTSANTGTIDPTTSNLMNDLDIRVTKDGVTYYPWTLNPAAPENAAVRTSDNFRDNFEKIQIDNPNGTYTITVSHKNSLNLGSQNYTLVVSGPQMNLDAEQFVADKSVINIYPNPASDFLRFDSSDFTDISEIQIIDVAGKVIMTRSDISNKSIDVSNLQAGVYFAKFKTRNQFITKKFIKK